MCGWIVSWMDGWLDGLIGRFLIMYLGLFVISLSLGEWPFLLHVTSFFLHSSLSRPRDAQPTRVDCEILAWGMATRHCEAVSTRASSCASSEHLKRPSLTSLILLIVIRVSLQVAFCLRIVNSEVEINVVGSAYLSQLWTSNLLLGSTYL